MGDVEKFPKDKYKIVKNLTFFAGCNGKFSIIEGVYIPPLSRPLITKMIQLKKDMLNLLRKEEIEDLYIQQNKKMKN
jgi:hypothetical protein